MAKTLDLFSATCLIFISACSSVTISSNTSSNSIVFGPKAKHTRDISIKVQKEYYLWGLVPDTRELRLDREFAERGTNSVAEVQIKEEPTGTDLAWTLFTLGFYAPRTYVLKGKTVESTRRFLKE